MLKPLLVIKINLPILIPWIRTARLPGDWISLSWFDTANPLQRQIARNTDSSIFIKFSWRFSPKCAQQMRSGGKHERQNNNLPHMTSGIMFCVESAYSQCGTCYFNHCRAPLLDYGYWNCFRELNPLICSDNNYINIWLQNVVATISSRIYHFSSLIIIVTLLWEKRKVRLVINKL